MGVADAAPILAALFLIILVSRSGEFQAAGALASPLRKWPGAAPFLLRDVGSERIDLTKFAPSEINGYSNSARRADRQFGKRALDVAAALTLLILASPLVIAVAVIIKLDSPGPALYRQRRIGFGGREFDMLKFRSMVVDAEKNGPQWAATNDCRVTRIGRIIRRTRFDEIPQAFNILSGQMSFVGPRPERPEFVKLLETEIPNYHLRHVVRPGLTGWAQVKYVYGASVEDARVKLQYDLHYIKHFTLWLDCLIMLMTVRVALFGVGSR